MDFRIGTLIGQLRRSSGRQSRIGGLHWGQRGPLEAEAPALVARGSARRDPSTSRWQQALILSSSSLSGRVVSLLD